MINLSWLKTFCTLADVGHFTQTADILFMTQSGVSQQIKKLEQHLHTELLIREGKSFSLTPAGNKLYQQGKLLLENFQVLEQSLVENDQYAGTIKIMSPGSIGIKLYPYLLDIQRQHPKLIFHYQFAPNNSIENAIINHQCDLGLMTIDSHQSHIHSRHIASENLVLVTEKNLSQCDWQQLLNIGFISHPDAAHHANKLLSENFNEFQHVEQFRQVGFSNQIHLILEPVSRGIGFTVLPINAVRAFSNQSAIRIHHLETPVSEAIYLCENRAVFKSKSQLLVKELVEKYLKN